MPSDPYKDMRWRPVAIGDRVMLNSGSPPLLVVDLAGNDVTVAWEDGGRVREATFSRQTLYRGTSNV